MALFCCIKQITSYFVVWKYFLNEYTRKLKNIYVHVFVNKQNCFYTYSCYENTNTPVVSFFMS